MEKEFIPFNLALKLKELGFDEPCLAYFKIEYDALNQKHFGCLSFPKDIKDLESQKKMTYCIGQMTLLAPTWQSAFKFFRDKGGIHIFPSEYDEKKWWINWGSWTSELFDTYEEAQEKCLLKMFDIVELIFNKYGGKK